MNEELRKDYKDRKSKEKIAIITGSCMIIAAIIGTVSISINVNTENEKLKKEYEEVISKNTDLNTQTNESQEAYENLSSQYESMASQNNELQTRVSSLESELSQHSSIYEENTELKKDIENLQNEIRELQGKNENPVDPRSNEEESEGQSNSTQPSSKKVSIFDLETFQGNDYWFDHSQSSSAFIDTYDNEYLTGRYTFNGPSSKDEDLIPVYLLDKKYSICEGELAWSKTSKNIDGSIWIDFYSGDTLIFSTETITATDRAITFEFSVEGLETLTVVCNGSNSNNAVTAIYPYLNLVE